MFLNRDTPIPAHWKGSAVKRYNAYLRDMIIAGKAKPGFVVSHNVPLDDAPDAYTKFDQRIDGYTKVILKP